MEIPFLQEQLITCLGNKRALLQFIEAAIQDVRTRLGGRELHAADLFAGSGAVARLLMQHSRSLVVNDLELYSTVLSQCYLSTEAQRGQLPIREVWQTLTHQLHNDERRGALREGIISRWYAPRDDQNIQRGERAFYTRRNGCYIDTARQYIAGYDLPVQRFLIAPLLVEASIHANTSGVFKGFYKDRQTGIGSFGGSGGDALTRILSPIHIPFPLFSPRDCPVAVYQMDANTLAREYTRLQNGEPVLDLVYLDPPYNQHPYGSNYFMLNLIAGYQEPREASAVSGIPRDWNRSAYNSPRHAFSALSSLVESLCAIPTRFLLVSFNSEGFISRDRMVAMLERVGTVEVREQRYNTFRGSRNLRNRAPHVREYLFLVTCREGGRVPRQ